MEVFSYIALLLLSFAGYSAGVTVKAGKNTEVKPQAVDLILVLALLALALWIRIAFDLNKWLLIGMFLVIGISVGIIATVFRKFPAEISAGNDIEPTAKNVFRRFWNRWKGFSEKMGGFQTRITFSYCFFIFILPVSIVLRLTKDPMNLKHKEVDSFWKPKQDTLLDNDHLGKQF